MSSDTYKVVFGDLNIAQMQYDELVQIEPDIAAAPQPEPNVSSTLTDDQMKKYYASMKNAKRMVMACWQYSQKHEGQWPETLKDLIAEGLSEEVFVNPVQPDNPDSYVYVKPADPGNRSNPAKTVVIYETYDTWGIGINVGFLDGHVEFIRDEQKFQDLLSK
jgi:prepilin-type processing-associated H-X9-DG protein